MATRRITRYRTRFVRARGRRRSKSFTVPVAAVGGFIPTVALAYQGYKTGRGIEGIGHYVLAGLTGWDTDTSTWKPQWMAQGLVPILAGFAVHKLASKMGVNRALASAGVPIFRV